MAQDTAEEGEAREVSVEAAARQLGESVPYLLELLDAGAIAFRTVAGERRVTVGDVQAFARRRARSTDALSEIAKIVEDSPAGWDH
jgi:hypothetical protein